MNDRSTWSMALPWRSVVRYGLIVAGVALLVVAVAFAAFVWCIAQLAYQPETKSCQLCLGIYQRETAEESDVSFTELLDGGEVNAVCSEPGFQEGLTPLTCAAAYRDLEVMRLLIEHGADVNQKNGNGSTPMISVVVGWHDGELVERECAELLLQHGADVSASGDYGKTPLHWAVEDGGVDATRWLVEHGADVDARMNDGRTPSMIARDRGHLELLELLQ